MREIINHYESCLEKHKGTPAEVDWTDSEAADIRYKMFSSFIRACSIKSNLTTPYSLLDFGCGTGNFIKYLSPFGCNYTGYDASEKMILEAKSRYKNNFLYAPADKFSDVLDSPFNYVIANGVFTEKRSIPKDKMWSYTKNTIKTLYGICSNSIAINFMNFHSLPEDRHREELFFLKYSDIVELCKEIGIESYIIDYSYLPYEFCLKVYK